MRVGLGIAAAVVPVVFVLFGSAGIAEVNLGLPGRTVSPGTVLDRSAPSVGAAERAESAPTSQVPADSTAAEGSVGSPAGTGLTGRTVGSLPDSAEASDSPRTAQDLPSSQTVALPAWRLGAPVSYANGAIKARPLPRSVSPIRRKGAVTALATKLAAEQFGGSLRPADVDAFFAEFDAPVGEWLGKVESVETEPRSAWFVVFTGMESNRSTGVVVRKRDAAHPPSTVSLRVVSDVVVVIDDDTGEVLVASEFLSEGSHAGR